jgi:hypothetical protein
MNEKELGKALLRREADINAKAIADKVIRRDRGRIWGMMFGCVAAWMLVVMFAWATILPMLAKVGEHERQTLAATTLTPAEQKEHLAMARALNDGVLFTFLGSICTTLIASICTVRLITATRTATLRQVNARLDEISAQVRLLASSLPK